MLRSSSTSAMVWLGDPGGAASWGWLEPDGVAAGSVAGDRVTEDWAAATCCAGDGCGSGVSPMLAVLDACSGTDNIRCSGKFLRLSPARFYPPVRRNYMSFQRRLGRIGQGRLSSGATICSAKESSFDATVLLHYARCELLHFHPNSSRRVSPRFTHGRRR